MNGIQEELSETKGLAFANAAMFAVWFVAYWCVRWDVDDGFLWHIVRFVLPLVTLMVAGKVLKDSVETRFREGRWCTMGIGFGVLPMILWALHWMFI